MLKTDKTVVAVGTNDYGQCDVGDWTDIIQVATGGRHTVGLKSDGTVVAAGPVSSLAKLSEWNLVVTDFEGATSVNWLLICCIIVGVIAVGLVIFFVRRKRSASTEGH